MLFLSNVIKVISISKKLKTCREFDSGSSASSRGGIHYGRVVAELATEELIPRSFHSTILTAFYFEYIDLATIKIIIKNKVHLYNIQRKHIYNNPYP
ncbi:MAG: hypothetical protein JO297_13395 [Nitrososphaeraceae archaeon]|nr:hypothetical protein [Nitrososphaeraceae archaeon]